MSACNSRSLPRGLWQRPSSNFWRATNCAREKVRPAWLSLVRQIGRKRFEQSNPPLLLADDLQIGLPEMLRATTCAVFGGSGFLGQRLCKRLLLSGVKVRSG